MDQEMGDTVRPRLRSLVGRVGEEQQCDGCGRRNRRGDIECQGCGYVSSSTREFSQHSVGAWEGRMGQEEAVDFVRSRFQGMNVTEQVAMNFPEAIPAQRVREEVRPPTTGFQRLPGSSNVLQQPLAQQQLLSQQLFPQQMLHQTLLPQQFLYSQPILPQQAPHLQPIVPQQQQSPQLQSLVPQQQQLPHLQPLVPQQQQTPHLQPISFPLQPQVFPGQLPILHHQPGPSSRESFIWLLERELHLQRELEVLAREKVAGGLSRENLIPLLERELALQRELDRMAMEKAAMEAGLQLKRKEEQERMAIAALQQQEQGRMLVLQQEQHWVMVEEQRRREEDKRSWQEELRRGKDENRRMEEEGHRRIVEEAQRKMEEKAHRIIEEEKLRKVGENVGKNVEEEACRKAEKEAHKRKEEYQVYASKQEIRHPNDSVEGRVLKETMGGVLKEGREGMKQEAGRKQMEKVAVRGGDEEFCRGEGDQLLQGALGEKDLVRKSTIEGGNKGSDESIINATNSTRLGNNTTNFFYSEDELSRYENNDELVFIDEYIPTAEASAEGAAVEDTAEKDVVLQQEEIMEQIRKENEAERQSKELVSRLAQESGHIPRGSEFPARDVRTVKGPSSISGGNARDKIAALKAAAEAQGSCVLGNREGGRGRDRVEEMMREQERQVERLRREAEDRERESRRQAAEMNKKIQVTAALTVPREEGTEESAGGINFAEVFAMAERKRTAEKSNKKVEEREEKLVRARRKSEAMAEMDSERRLAGEVIRQRQAAQVGRIINRPGVAGAVLQSPPLLTH